MTDITQLTDETLKSCLSSLKENDYVVIDIREPDEYARERIPGSINIPLSKLANHDFSAIKHKTALFHCRSGNRTKLAKDKILASGFDAAYCLDGGIDQWKRCGFAVVTNQSAPIEIMRQVQIVVGAMILLGLLLAYFVSPYFILLTVIAGVGMLAAGITGYCGMAKCLMLMPWNNK